MNDSTMDHGKALELAAIRYNTSNLARCYIELHRKMFTSTPSQGERSFNVQTRTSLIEIEGLCKFLTADLEEGKTAKFVDTKPSFLYWPSLTFCIHEGSLYQLFSTGAIVGYDANNPPGKDEDVQKLWVKVRKV